MQATRHRRSCDRAPVGATRSVEALTLCDQVAPELVEPFVGRAAPEAYEFERYSECRWRSASAATVVGREAVQTGRFTQLTPSLTVLRLQIGDEAVWFLDEALVARVGNAIVMVRAESVALDNLVPVLEAVTTGVAESG